jgi:hypothetical protein
MPYLIVFTLEIPFVYLFDPRGVPFLPGIFVSRFPFTAGMDIAKLKIADLIASHYLRFPDFEYIINIAVR